jgi:EmrB/QacA subfamily drug resistance transporter
MNHHTVTGQQQRPRGDSFGSRGETVVTSQSQPRALRTLRQRQLALLVLCVASLVIILDASVVNVALPSIKEDLDFAQNNLAWVVNAYLIPFGGILLFAGRLGDLVGAKKVFVTGLAIFTAASLACGFAQDQIMLISARFVQGVGGALASAVVLAMIIHMFPKPGEQGRAVAFYSFIASSGAIIGLIVGALLTEGPGWNWVFFVNAPIGVVAVLAAVRLLPEAKDDDTSGVDVVGTILLVGSMMTLVYTLVQAVDNGWTSQRTLLLGGGALVGLVAFVLWQWKYRNPLMPFAVLAGRNAVWPGVAMGLLATGPTALFFLGALYFQQVRRLTVLEVGMAFLPAAVILAAVSLKVAPRLIKKLDAKWVLVGGLTLMAAGLAWLGRLPVDGHYAIDVLPSLVLLGFGAGVAVPSGLGAAVADATRADSGVRSGLVNTTQQLGGALGLGILATVAAGQTGRDLAAGEAANAALVSGYGLAFLVGAGILLLGVIVALVFVKPVIPKTAPDTLDSTRRGVIPHEENLTGVVDPDFLAIGLSGTNMMAMLWSIAHGKRAVGVELRGDPAEAVMHWTIREDMWHHLAVIDQMMIDRYGTDRLPTLGTGEPFLLHKCLFNPDADSIADVRADEVLSGYAGKSHVGGLVKSVHLIDDRWVNGRPTRRVAALGAVENPGTPNPKRVGRPMEQVLAEQSAFQAGAQEILLVLRRYLAALEDMDLKAGVEPRCRVFTYHRVVVPRTDRTRTGPFGKKVPVSDGFVPMSDGRRRVQIEAVRELEDKRGFRRVRRPGTEVIDLGVPELFMIAEGLDSDDAKRLGFQQTPMLIDHGDGRGPVVAQSDYLVGLMTMYMDSRYRWRITSEFDKQGNEYWVRQFALGHQDDAEIGWIAAELPDFMTLDPVLAGLVPEGTDPKSRQYYAGYQHLLREYYLDQVAIMTEVSRDQVARTSIARSPVLYTVVARTGLDAQVAGNGVVAGDSFGNGNFLTSGGFNTGVIGHAARVGRYWQERAGGAAPQHAVRRLADGIKDDTAGWLKDSTSSFRQPATRGPGGAVKREDVLSSTRRHRRSINPVNYRDEWSRLHVFVGRIYSFEVPKVQPTHPLARRHDDWPTTVLPVIKVDENDVPKVVAESDSEMVQAPVA